MINTTGLWVAEYNAKQGKYHVQELQHTLDYNKKNHDEDKDGGNWHIIGIFEDHREAGDYIQELRTKANRFKYSF
jgi:hypothetical protein